MQMITACPYTTNWRARSAPSFSKIAGVDLQRGSKMVGEVGPVVAAGFKSRDGCLKNRFLLSARRQQNFGMVHGC